MRNGWTVFDLLWLVVFVGGGLAIGGRVHGSVGAVVGACLGFGLLSALGRLLRQEAERQPPCQCGVVGSPFKTSHDQKIKMIVSTCSSCGRVYAQQRGSIWNEVLPDGHLTPIMRRTFLGGWKSIEKNSV